MNHPRRTNEREFLVILLKSYLLADTGSLLINFNGFLLLFVRFAIAEESQSFAVKIKILNFCAMYGSSVERNTIFCYKSLLLSFSGRKLILKGYNFNFFFCGKLRLL